jgi:hypothetical protein
LSKTHDYLIPGLLAMSGVILVFCGTYSTSVFPQQSTSSHVASAQNRAAEVVSLCNPNKVESFKSEGKTTYTCEGKRPAPRQGAASRYKDASARGPRADINCSYSETGGDMKWLACTCAADEDSKCTGFITWCAAQGDEVSGNSGSASCVPGG